jgi:uncharacterized protein YcfL
MKKFVLFTVLTFVLAACGSKKTEEAPIADDEEVVAKATTDITTENIDHEGSEKTNR